MSTDHLAPADPGWTRVRAKLLADWNVAPESARFSRFERNNLIEVRNELHRVADVQAWRAVTALSGQLIESHLKQRLMRDGKRSFSEVSTLMMDSLIKAALADGVFSTEATLGISNSIFTAKQLRNSASHGSAWERSPDEADASISLVLLVCYSGWLFSPVVDVVDVPQDATDEWWAALPKVSASGAASRLAVMDFAGSFDEQEVRWLFSRIFNYGAIGAILNMVERVRRYPRAWTVLGEVTESHLIQILSAVGRGAVEHAEVLGRLLTGLGYPDYARAVWACLPTDPAAFRYYLARTPVRFAYYLRALRRIDARRYERLILNPETRRSIIAGLEETISAGKVSLTTVGVILSHMPKTLRIELLSKENVILASAQYRDPYQVCTLIKATIVTGGVGAEAVAGLRSRIVEILIARANKEDPALFQLLVWRLAKLNLIHVSDVDRLLKELIVLAKSAINPSVSQNILWDMIQLNIMRDEAIEVAAELVNKDWPAWERLCLLGALHTLEYEVPRKASVEDATIASQRLDCSRWELYRVLLACARSGDVAVRAATAPLVSRAAKVIKEPHFNQSETAAKLLQDVAYIVSASTSA